LRGKLYGVGVGPGDPELMTLKALKSIMAADILAIPMTGKREHTALSIVNGLVDLEGKEQYFAHMPMTKNLDELEKCHEKVAVDIVSYLDQGKNVVFLTLGDPTIYSTYCYIHSRVMNKGYDAEIIPGVPSFCAVAARLNQPLCEMGEPLHILPASYGDVEEYLDWKGTKVLMKSGKEFDRVRQLLIDKGLLEKSKMVSRCGMEQEEIFTDITKAETEASYFSVIVVKERNI
jgi:precorrin-2/cobalt-factor-2 C20-methyltransferase